ALAARGFILLDKHKYAEAEPLLRECLTIREKTMGDNWLHFNTLSMLGGALLGQSKHTDAEPLLRQGYEGMKKREAQIPPQGKKRLLEAAERLALLYEAIGRPDEARAWRAMLPPTPRTDRAP